jgi:hypothetical protein
MYHTKPGGHSYQKAPFIRTSISTKPGRLKETDLQSACLESNRESELGPPDKRRGTLKVNARDAKATWVRRVRMAFQRTWPDCLDWLEEQDDDLYPRERDCSTPCTRYAVCNRGRPQGNLEKKITIILSAFRASPIEIGQAVCNSIEGIST